AGDPEAPAHHARPGGAGGALQPGDAPARVADRLRAEAVAREEDHHHEGDDDHAAGGEEVEDEGPGQVVAGSEPVQVGKPADGELDRDRPAAAAGRPADEVAAASEKEDDDHGENDQPAGLHLKPIAARPPGPSAPPAAPG